MSVANLLGNEDIGWPFWKVSTLAVATSLPYVVLLGRVSLKNTQFNSHPQGPPPGQGNHASSLIPLLAPGSALLPPQNTLAMTFTFILVRMSLIISPSLMSQGLRPISCVDPLTYFVLVWGEVSDDSLERNVASFTRPGGGEGLFGRTNLTIPYHGLCNRARLALALGSRHTGLLFYCS